MVVEVAKVELKTVQDASGLVERILAGQCAADQAYRRVRSSMASGPKRNAAALEALVANVDGGRARGAG